MVAVVVSSVALPIFGLKVLRLGGCLLALLSIVLSVVIGFVVLLVREPNSHFGPMSGFGIIIHLTISAFIVFVTLSGVGMAEEKR